MISACCSLRTPSSRKRSTGSGARARRRNNFPQPQGAFMYRWIGAAVVALSLAGTARAAIKEQPVTYKDGETTMKGFVVYDDAKKGKRPGIVLVHEWWGITKHIHNEARRFAREGYSAFIADMFGDGKTADNP